MSLSIKLLCEAMPQQYPLNDKFTGTRHTINGGLPALRYALKPCWLPHSSAHW